MCQEGAQGCQVNGAAQTGAAPTRSQTFDSPAKSLLPRHPLPAPTSSFPKTSLTRSGDSFSMTLDFWSLELVGKSGHAEEWRV